MSRLCEAFHCGPAAAERLWLDDPDDTAIRILEYRAYADAKRAYDEARGDLSKLERHPMIDQVVEHVFAEQQRRHAARRAG